MNADSKNGYLPQFFSPATRRLRSTCGNRSLPAELAEARGAVEPGRRIAAGDVEPEPAPARESAAGGIQGKPQVSAHQRHRSGPVDDGGGQRVTPQGRNMLEQDPCATPERANQGHLQRRMDVELLLPSPVVAVGNFDGVVPGPVIVHEIHAAIEK